MKWFGKRRRQPEIPGTELQDDTKQHTDTDTTPASRGGTGQAKNARRKASAQRTHEYRLSLDKDIRGDSSVTGTVSSSGASRRRRLPTRRHKLLYFERSSREDITALPGSRELNISPHLRPVALEDADIPYNFYAPSASHTSMPNLPGSRGGRRSSIKRAADNTALPKRQPTKRRKDEHVREEEIRAMSGPANTGRPRRTTYDSGMLRKDSKKFRGGLNRNFERPMSNVSLPPAESVHSSMSGGSDPFSYHLSRLDLFAPRPMIRQSINGQYASGLNASMWSARADSRANERRANRKPTPSREILKGSKTVDALADNLDSSDLRAVLERDQRRKDQKRQKEMEKAKRRLERKAEKDRAREMGETDSPSKRKRKDLEKHLGLGIESPLLSEVEAPKRKKKDLEKHLGDKFIDSKELAALQASKVDNSALQKETSAGTSAGPSSPAHGSQVQLGTPLDEAALLNIHPAFRPSPAQTPKIEHDRMQLPTPEPSAHDRLQKIVTAPVPQDDDETSPDTIEALPPLPSSPTKTETPTSRQGSRRSSKGWTSIFRRGPSLRKEQERTDSPAEPATFSNVSRESVSRNLASRASFAAATASGPVVVPARSMSQTNSEMQSDMRRGSASTAATRRDRSGTPVRTMSKFREDLPELPLSTTDLSISRRASSAVPRNTGLSPALPLPPDMGMGEDLDPSPVEDKHRSTGMASESLASVDSEASWISGRPVKRPSVRLSARNSVTSSLATRRQNRSANASQEHLGLGEDNANLTRNSSSRMASVRSSQRSGKKPASMAQNDEEDVTEDATEIENYFRRSSIQEGEALTLKTGDVGRTATLHGRGSMVKSREGLLNEFNAGNEQTAQSSATQQPSAAERSLPTPDPEDTPVSPVISERSFALPSTPTAADMEVRRADSVKVNQAHARQVSAGSAKLLDIIPRSRPGTSNGPSSSQAHTPTRPTFAAATPAADEAAERKEQAAPQQQQEEKVVATGPEVREPASIVVPTTEEAPAEQKETVAPAQSQEDVKMEEPRSAPEPEVEGPSKVQAETAAPEPTETDKEEVEPVSAPSAQKDVNMEDPPMISAPEVKESTKDEPEAISKSDVQTEDVKTKSAPNATSGAETQEAATEVESAEVAKPIKLTPTADAAPSPEADATAGAQRPLESLDVKIVEPLELTEPGTAEQRPSEAISNTETAEPAKSSPGNASATATDPASKPGEAAKSDSAAFVEDLPPSYV